MQILYINACVRDCSRTRILARHFLNRLSGDITEIELCGADTEGILSAVKKR